MKTTAAAFLDKSIFDPEVTFDVQTNTIHVTGPSPQQVANELLLRFHADVDDQLRKALIEMGWTPPDVDPTLEEERGSR